MNKYYIGDLINYIAFDYDLIDFYISKCKILGKNFQNYIELIKYDNKQFEKLYIKYE